MSQQIKRSPVTGYFARRRKWHELEQVLWCTLISEKEVKSWISGSPAIRQTNKSLNRAHTSKTQKEEQVGYIFCFSQTSAQSQQTQIAAKHLWLWCFWVCVSVQIIIPLIARCRCSGWFYSVLITPHQCPHLSPKVQKLPSANITLKTALVSFAPSLHSVIWYQNHITEGCLLSF